LNHPDLQQPRISRDEADVQSLEARMEDSWVNNPFRSDQDRLIHLATAAVAPGDIVCDLTNAQNTGEELYQTFKRDRLGKTAADPDTVDFFATMKKQQLQTFSDVQKGEVQGKGACA